MSGVMSAKWCTPRQRGDCSPGPMAPPIPVVTTGRPSPPQSLSAGPSLLDSTQTPSGAFSVHSTLKPASAKRCACDDPAVPEGPRVHDGDAGEQAALPPDQGGAGQQERAEVLGKELGDGGGHVEVADGAFLRLEGVVEHDVGGGVGDVDDDPSSSAADSGPAHSDQVGCHDTRVAGATGPAGASGISTPGSTTTAPSARAASVSTGSVPPPGRRRARLPARRCGPWRLQGRLPARGRRWPRRARASSRASAARSPVEIAPSRAATASSRAASAWSAAASAAVARAMLSAAAALASA